MAVNGTIENIDNDSKQADKNIAAKSNINFALIDVVKDLISDRKIRKDLGSGIT